jgi:MSHA biogenesis protein MshL
MRSDLDALLEDPPRFAWFAPWPLALFGVVTILLLTGCASPRSGERALLPEVRAALSEPAQSRPAPLPPAVANALVPPADLSLPSLNGKTAEPRFDLNVVGLPAAQVFAALAKDTRYSMLVDPSLTTPVTVNLKDVTLVEALDTLRDMYGFEYRVQGTRVFVQPATLATRVFQVNYLTANRAGRSDVRVTSGSITASGAGGQSGTTPAPGQPAPTVSQESSRITTESKNDLWIELQASLRLLIGADGKTDRQVIVSPQSGVIVVRALPRELRAVEQYLRASRLNVERQVMLEAKIIEVSLRDGSQTGVNWAAFISGNNHAGSIGPITPGTTLNASGAVSSGPLTATPGSSLALAANAANGLFGLAFQTSNFAALLQFLETQGNVQVLSSPRIAALNNQKAVLKVGTDDFFVTGITTTTTTSGAGAPVVSPTITVQPFFSGIALDVMPQIDENANIILHVHPSVSSVAERTKVLNLGTLGDFTLPLASSTMSETDTIVRVRDGAIVAIGGLMKASRSYDRNQLPGAGDIPVAGNLFGSTARASEKSELVILIKPTVINSDAQLDAVRDGTLDRLDALAARPER